MSKKTKRYLMLLVAVGLIAVAAGGSGTFASFNAQTTNAGNIFSSGTLLLHNTHNSTVCASESTANNQVTAGCAVLFNYQVSLASGTLQTGLTNGQINVTSLTLAAPGVIGIDIQTGDSIVVTSGTNTQTFTASQPAAIGATAVNITSVTSGAAFPAGSIVTADTSTRYATLELKNAGTLDAADIKFSASPVCADGIGGTNNATLNQALPAGAQTTITVSPIAIALRTGDSITISEGGNSETLIAAAPANVGAVNINVTGSPTTNAYTSGVATLSWGPTFTGGGGLCSQLKLVVIETSQTFGHDATTAPAIGCAFGSFAANIGCSFGADTLGSIASTTTALSLVTGAGTNTGVQLNAGSSRYFVIGVRATSLGNGYQNKTASFGLKWHIDQA